MGANASYVNTAGQTVPTYGASPSQPSQYGNTAGYTGQPASQYGNTGYASQSPQYPAYPPAPQQTDLSSGFGQLSLNSSGGGSQNPAFNTASAPAYPGYQNPVDQGSMYSQTSQSGSWNQAPQVNAMSQGSGNYQQQGYNAPAYHQQPPSGGPYY